MRRWLMLCLFLSGCHSISLPGLESDSKFEMVRPGAFGSMAPPPPQGRVTITKNDNAQSLRVEAVGRKILTANPDINLKPLFATHRAPHLEIFHQGPSLLHVTEGLVARCDTDAKLAAVLSYELAEMVADREMLAHPRMRQAEPRPPQEVTIGSGIGPMEADLAAQAELARYDKQRQQAKKKLQRPDPDKLARLYLTQAGFAPGDLDTVKPLLREAETTYQMEKVIRTAEAASGWQNAREAAEKQAQDKKDEAQAKKDPPPQPTPAASEPPMPPPPPLFDPTIKPRVIPLGPSG